MEFNTVTFAVLASRVNGSLVKQSHGSGKCQGVDTYLRIKNVDALISSASSQASVADIDFTHRPFMK